MGFHTVETCKNGDEIRLMDGEYNENKITIGKSITITGLNKDKANIKTRLVVAPEVDVTIQNCTFKNTDEDTFGEAILNSGDLSVVNCHFEGIRALVNGGAVCNMGNADIRSSEFVNNVARSCGGAISNSVYSNINAHYCNFIDNSAKWGKAIFASRNCKVNATNNWWNNPDPYTQIITFQTTQLNIEPWLGEPVPIN